MTQWQFGNTNHTGQNDAVLKRNNGVFWLASPRAKQHSKAGDWKYGSKHAFVRVLHQNKSRISRFRWTTNLNKNWQMAHRSHRLSTYMTNMLSIFPNTKHTARIDQIKMWAQNFEARYLSLYLTNSQTTTCTMLYIQSSLKRIKQFKQKRNSKTDLRLMAAMDLEASRCNDAKQMRVKV